MVFLFCFGSFGVVLLLGGDEVETVDTLLRPQTRALVVDLRNNSGGNAAGLPPLRSSRPCLSPSLRSPVRSQAIAVPS